MSPIYEYECSRCGLVWEAYHHVDDREEETCLCGKRAKKRLSVTAHPVVYEYFSESLNAHITGPKQKQEIMKRLNVSEAG